MHNIIYQDGNFDLPPPKNIPEYTHFNYNQGQIDKIKILESSFRES